MNFPSALKRELSLWVRDGLVDEGQAAEIEARYADEDGGTSSLLLTAVYAIGACLVGGGAISFVAAHWETMPIPLRIGLLMSIMAACQIAGFVLWKVKGTRPGLGQALVVLGALVFGASIFLIAQMYHLHGPPHVAFGVWTLGAAAVAYATFSGPVMLLACLTSMVWAAGWVEARPHEVFWYPAALCLAAAPFLRRRSVLALTGVLLAAAIAIAIAVAEDADKEWAWLLTLVALGALYRGFGLWLKRRNGGEDLALPALVLGGVAVLVPAFYLSFYMGPEKSVVKDLWVAAGWGWTAWLAAAYVGAAISWWAAWRLAPGTDETRLKPLAMPVAAVLVSLGIAAGQAVVLCVMANLGLLAVAVSLLWNAVSLGQRRQFWLGLGLLALVVVSRFFEWDTHLMVKSAVFVLCGIGVMVGGAWFERRLKGGAS